MGAQTQAREWLETNAYQPVTRRHILVVDDDPSIVRLLKEILEVEGYRVSCAYDGDAALRQVRDHAFNLIVMDVNMPVTNGFQVLQHLRASPTTARIPVIFVTGEPSADVYPVVSRDPRAAHVKKPMELESFNSVVRQHLERYPYP